ncbi:hypothetical protein FACS1894132_10120 [Clostridia bacterium]|nr:hypothetical protein FACS1894132_10120 [Clostridia bacterium]
MKKIITILLSGMLLFSTFSVSAFDYLKNGDNFFLSGQTLKERCISSFLNGGTIFTYEDGTLTTSKYLETLPSSFFEKNLGTVYRISSVNQLLVRLSKPIDNEFVEKFVENLSGVKSWDFNNADIFVVTFADTNIMLSSIDLILENENVISASPLTESQPFVQVVIVPYPPVAEKLKTPTISNLVICSKYINDTVIPSKEDAFAYDLNSDGLVNGVDFSLLKRKLISQFSE